MPNTVHVEAGELSADEILEALREGRRIVIETDRFGGSHTITLRHDGSTYYCDTPTTLHKHDSEQAMRDCIEKMGYSTP